MWVQVPPGLPFGGNMKYKLKNIKWDTDGEDPKELGLPSSLVVDPEELNLDYQVNMENPDLGDDLCIGDAITDWLSDTYGWLVGGFDFRLVADKKCNKKK